MTGGYSPTDIAGWMEASTYGPNEQLRQTAFRAELVEAWGIQSGERVLEIGCGQGDTTAVLAAAVGPSGRVVAVDVAPVDYGAPVSLGDSAARLITSPVGEQIEFHFECSDWTGVGSDFDVAVLSMCSWYIYEPETLLGIFSQLRKQAKRLCFAEWENEITKPMQSGHSLAVKFQQDLGSFGFSEQLNIKSAWSRDEILSMLDDSGWKVKQISEFPEPGLDDGKWELQTSLALDPVKLGIPPEGLPGFGQFQEWLRESVDQDQCLPIFSLVAT
ncbi:MAG TPA: methyltransferase domain-containing protein [Fimbriimonas sp.]|nr:methyltransferase domain-containing protein [Fimbriimonas sp.]